MSRFAFAAAFGLLLWAAASVQYRTPAEPETVVQVLDPSPAEPPVGESAFTVTFRNPTSRLVKVVDVQEGCGLNCCFKPRLEGSREIPPGGVLEVPGQLRVRAAGPFEFVGDVYLDDDGLRTIKFKISGTAG